MDGAGIFRFVAEVVGFGFLALIVAAIGQRLRELLGGLLPNARLPHGGVDARMRRSAAAKKGARVRSAIAARREAGPARDSEWGPEGERRGSASVDGVHSIADILDRLPRRST